MLAVVVVGRTAMQGRESSLQLILVNFSALILAVYPLGCFRFSHFHVSLSAVIRGLLVVDSTGQVLLKLAACQGYRLSSGILFA